MSVLSSKAGKALENGNLNLDRLTAVSKVSSGTELTGNEVLAGGK